MNEIAARWAAATKGPWRVGNGEKESFYTGDNTVVSTNRVIVERAIYNNPHFDNQTIADIAAIAAAPTDIAFLLQRLAALREMLRKHVIEEWTKFDLLGRGRQMYQCQVCGEVWSDKEKHASHCEYAKLLEEEE